MAARSGRKTVTIVGLGLIGGSLAFAWKDAGFFDQVFALTRKEETLSKAVASGAIDRGFTAPGPWLSETDALVLATPVGSLLYLLDACLPYLSPGCAITDVGSVKQTIVRGAERRTQGVHYFLGGHPMAGSEKSGFDSARSDLFHRATYVLTPTSRTRDEDLEFWSAAAEAVKARVLIMDAEEHDRTVAWTSHLPLLVACSLSQASIRGNRNNPNFKPLIAGGFRDTTRVASGEPQMGADMCSFNRHAILEALQGFRASLDELEHLLAASGEDREPLRAALETIKHDRDQLVEGGF